MVSHTYISIRSAKHDSSTANSHQYDFVKLTELEEFKQSIRNKKGDIKPLLFVAVFCNAPGFSAYNRVERRMAPLSKDAAGIVLPFDKFGTHLNSSNKTIDEDLERKKIGFSVVRVSD